MKKEIIGEVNRESNIWYFETKERIMSADVVAGLDELLGADTSAGDKYKVTIEKL